MKSLIWKWPMAGVLAVVLGVSIAAAQQTAPQNPKAPAQTPKAPAQPPAQNPQAPAQIPDPGAEVAPPKAPVEVEPTGPVPPVMTFTKELITDAESDALSLALRKGRHKVRFRNAETNAETKDLVAKWAKWLLYRMTQKSNQRRLHELRSELMQDIAGAGQGKGIPRKQLMEFRYLMCEEVTKRASELLKNNFYVRLNAAIILAQLNLVEDDTQTRDAIEEQAYVKAALPLLEVINAPTGGGVDEQLEAVKIQAAIGLGRINLLGPLGDLNINVQDQNFRNVVAKALIAQLEDPQANIWYQKRLIDALGCIDMVNDVATGKPIIVQKLGEVLADREREFSVRARAARALGRCPLPPGINVQKLVYQILLLENEMAVAYQKEPNHYYWLDCFQDVYFAFHPTADSESLLYSNKRPPGLNQKNLGTLVQEAYQQLLPVASHVVNQPRWTPPKEDEKLADNAPIPSQMVADLSKWLQDHQPADHKLAPTLPELDPGSPIPTTASAK